MTEDESYAKAEASIGSLSLSVEGKDEEWVSEKFDEKLDRLLQEAEDMSQAVLDGSRACQ